MDHPDNPPSVNSSQSDKSDSKTSVLTEEAQSSDESAQEQATPDLPPAPPPSAGKTTEAEPPDGEGKELGAKMTFLEHLDELRKRILHSAAAVGIAFCLCWVISEDIFKILAVPIADVVAPGTDAVQGMKALIFTKPTEPFSIWLKVSFVAAIFLATPYLMVQVWLFIAPGLYRKEKAYAVPFLLSSTTLFLLGGIFAYYIILPTALEFLINQFGAPFTPMVSAIEYFNFEVIILVGMGVIFQLPVLVAFLSLFGLVTPRFLWRNFRYAFLLIVIVAAVVSP
ncbi:MAG: twin-arginine translocase subunit TatC, partial [Acidobacteriota bacterium]